MPIDWFPLWLSLRVALMSTALALAAGLWIAYILANREFRGQGSAGCGGHAAAGPAAHRARILSAGAARAASPLGKLWEAIFGSPLVFTWKAAVVAALLHSFPLLVKSARAALESVDRSYERAARNLGASEWSLFWRVTLPLARRSIYRRGGARVRAIAGRFRRHAHGGRQHSGPHADGRGRDLRCGRSPATARWRVRWCW